MRASICAFAFALCLGGQAHAASTYTISGSITGAGKFGERGLALATEYGLREGAAFELKLTFNDSSVTNLFETDDISFTFDGVTTNVANFGAGLAPSAKGYGSISFASAVAGNISFDTAVQNGPYVRNLRRLSVNQLFSNANFRGVTLTQDVFRSFLPTAGRFDLLDNLYRPNGSRNTSNVFGSIQVTSVSLSGTPLTFSVPEPATWATMVLGFGLAGWGVRRARPLRGTAAAA